MKNIGIIGSGNVGGVLAKRLVEQGHKVKLANSRGRASLQDLTQRTGAKAVDIEDVSLDADVLIIAIPFARVRDLPKSIVSTLPRTGIIVDAGNYYPMRDGAIAMIDQGLPETEWVSQQLGAPAVKAFNNIIASRLATNGKPKGDRRRIALPVSGDDLTARATTMALVEEIGFNAFDAGLLAESWRQQPGQPAYCTDPTLEELPILLERANQDRAVRNRDNAAKIMAKLPTNYPAEQLVRVARFSIGLDKLKPRSWIAMLRLGITISRQR
jgi:8-hydroxy-5-deazaflavin:NADPH oxidoreductase